MAAELTDYLLREFKIEVLPNAREDDMACITVGALLRLASLTTQQAAQGAEPVGHVCFVAHRKAPDVEWAANVEIRNGAALYTAPPPTAEAVQALQRLHDWAQAMDPKCTYTGDHPIAQARAALRS